MTKDEAKAKVYDLLVAQEQINVQVKQLNEFIAQEIQKENKDNTEKETKK